MLKKKKVGVVIPSYKAKLNKNEKVSLNQCRKILGNYERIFVMPENLETDYVQDEIVKCVSSEWLSSRTKYSELMLTPFFYEMFCEYEYILIYQLDAFVFDDRLLEFCDLEYDYIGAPWYGGYEYHCNLGDMWFVGNGGFSLRKVEAFLSWLIKTQGKDTFEKKYLMEDLYIASKGSEELKIAPKDVAVDFAFELNVEKSFQINHEKLPFGCHAWQRFWGELWKKEIPSLGYDCDFIEPDWEVAYLSNMQARRQLFERYYNPDKMLTSVKQCLQKYCDGVYLWGSGHIGMSTHNLFHQAGIPVKLIIDSDPSKTNLEFEATKITSFDWIEKESSHPIVIAMLKPEAVIEVLQKNGYVYGVDFTTVFDIQKAILGEKSEVKLIHI